MSASDFRRYITQWVCDATTESIKIVGYCVRDTHSFEWTTVFEHADKVVCEKIAEILNEEEDHGIQK